MEQHDCPQTYLLLQNPDQLLEELVSEQYDYPKTIICLSRTQTLRRETILATDQLTVPILAKIIEATKEGDSPLSGRRRSFSSRLWIRLVVPKDCLGSLHTYGRTFSLTFRFQQSSNSTIDFSTIQHGGHQIDIIQV